MNRNVIVLLLVAFTVQIAPPATAGLQDSLNQQYANRILTFRHPFQNETQHYGSEGEPRDNGLEGPWERYGRIRVTQINVVPDGLVLEGRRIEYHGRRKEAKLTGAEVNKSVKVQIHLQQPLASTDEARTALARVFALETTQTDAAEVTRELWRWVEGQNLGETVYLPGKDVAPPKVRHSVEPNYPDSARPAGFTPKTVATVVIDHSGRVAQVVLLQPWGKELDESAVEALKQWTFQPATRNGQPVACEVGVEIYFNR